MDRREEINLSGLTMGVAGQPTDPLLQGFYTVPEAARLLRIGNTQRIYRWLGRENPVIARDFEPLEGSQELSFWDLFRGPFRRNV